MNETDFSDFDASYEFSDFCQSESIDDWSRGHDETGHNVFDYDQFADQLRLDAY